MEIKVLPGNLSMPDLLDDRGQLQLLPAAAYDAISHEALMVWCNRNARYGLPTVELVAWLKERIAGRSAIEIGSGAGDLAYHLGIPGTDSKIQKRPAVRAWYESMGQPVIRYPKFVQNLDAFEAIEEYKPEVVVASWVTHWVDPNKPLPLGEVGCMFGIKEDLLLATGVTYIMVGNLDVHRQKPIFSLPHKEYNLPFVRSRATFPNLNRVWVWEGSGR